MLRVVLRSALIMLAMSAPLASGGLAQDKVWRIGFLDMRGPPTADTPAANLAFFQRGLGELGYREGRNYVVEARFADTDRDRLPILAKELVDRGVDVIVTIGTPTVRAAKKATATIPIVMAGSQEPVENGFVASLARPGGNVTGLTHNPGPAFAGKGLQLLKQAAPQISRVAVLVDMGGGSNPHVEVQRAVAGDLKLTLLIHDLTGVKSAEDFDRVLAAVMAERADAVFVYPEFVINKYQQSVIDFISATYPIPAMFQQAEFVDKGGLLSYYTDFIELRRQAAGYVDKIFKGAKPADLPVQQPSRFELVINLTTAKALGLTFPPAILGFADRVVE